VSEESCHLFPGLERQRLNAKASGFSFVDHGSRAARYRQRRKCISSARGEDKTHTQGLTECKEQHVKSL
jgi:hypothetical protein